MRVTRRDRGLKKEQFLLTVSFVPSGIVEIGRLQGRQGFAYLNL
jgi:intracellular sulfur oxidation DsrE/DsrF family protein